MGYGTTRISEEKKIELGLCTFPPCKKKFVYGTGHLCMHHYAQKYKAYRLRKERKKLKCKACGKVVTK